MTEETEAAPPKRKRLFARWSNESIVALSALLISLCALTVSILEVRLMYQQQRAMVYPHLTLGINYNAEGYQVYVKNSGNGLAMVKQVQIWNEETYFQTWLDVVDAYLPEGHGIGYDVLTQNQFSGQVLPPGERILLFGLPWSEEARALEVYLRELDYRICYCSVMDECFTLDKEHSNPQPANCPGRTDPARLFQN